MLKGYLGQFYVPPLPLPTSKALASYMAKTLKTERVVAVIAPSEATMRQVAQVFLLSFGKQVTWDASSAYELVRRSFESEDTLSDLMAVQAVVLYAGFDHLDNKLTDGSLMQIVSGRANRNKPTLIIVRTKEAKFPYKQVRFETATAATAATPGPAGYTESRSSGIAPEIM